MSTALQKSLENISVQSVHLIDLCEALKEQNDLLSLENSSLGVALQTSESARKKLEEKLAALKLAMAVNTSKDTSDKLKGLADKQVIISVDRDSQRGVSEKNFDIKQKINEFVREIDKCITLLNK